MKSLRLIFSGVTRVSVVEKASLEGVQKKLKINDSTASKEADNSPVSSRFTQVLAQVTLQVHDDYYVSLMNRQLNSIQLTFSAS